MSLAWAVRTVGLHYLVEAPDGVIIDIGYDTGRHPIAAYARLVSAAPELDAFAEAALLFHSASPWDAEKASRWRELTGAEECTAKALCDFGRQVRAKVLGSAA
jgi:hypothetical protein